MFAQTMTRPTKQQASSPVSLSAIPEDPFMNRLAVTLAAVGSLIYIPYTVYTEVMQDTPSSDELMGAMFWAWFKGTASFMVGIVLDMLLLKSTWYNLKVARQTGLGWVEIIGGTAHTVLTAFGGLLLTAFLFPNTEARFDLSLVMRVTVTLIVTDVPYFLAHRFLHQHMPRTHLLHHCCMSSSWVSAFMLTPVDLMMEFFGPIALVLFVLGTDTFGLQDPFAAFCGLAVLLFWYAMGHDAVWQNAHYTHHKYINAKYNIYVTALSQGSDPKDTIRNLVKLPAAE